MTREHAIDRVAATTGRKIGAAMQAVGLDPRDRTIVEAIRSAQERIAALRRRRADAKARPIVPDFRWRLECRRAERVAAAARAPWLEIMRAWLLRPSARTAARIEAETIASGTATTYPVYYLRDLTAQLQVDVLAHWLTRRARRRWTADHRSVGRGYSRYLCGTDRRGRDVRLRLSDHALPETDERLHNQQYGRVCCDCELILDGTETWRETLRRLAAEL